MPPATIPGEVMPPSGIGPASDARRPGPKEAGNSLAGAGLGSEERAPLLRDRYR